MRRHSSDDHTTSHVAFGQIPHEIRKYVRTRDILGWTQLHYAAAWKNYEAREWIDSLLSKGADIDAPDIRGWTPLHYSIWNRNPGVVDIRLERGANVKVAGVDGITPLHCAAAEMTHHTVSDLIFHPRQRADQFATDNFGRAPIHLAAQEGNKHAIASLAQFSCTQTAESRKTVIQSQRKLLLLRWTSRRRQ
ncbi:ankyrin repeat-containing domain protein [Fusarium sp. MPI-SDFR-AT-0072]|nr:ankyrin repeat-containing domain protein [Fusarium sp. MPI-SDFR-AT-0072]